MRFIVFFSLPLAANMLVVCSAHQMHNIAYMGERALINIDSEITAVAMRSHMHFFLFSCWYIHKIALSRDWRDEASGIVTRSFIYALCFCLAHKNLSRLSTQITFIFNSHFDGCNCAFDRLRLSLFISFRLSKIVRVRLYSFLVLLLLWQATHA